MADNTVPITAGTGTSIRTVTNAAVDSGAHQQVVGLANSDGSLLPFDPDATLQVSNDPTTLLLDSFDAGNLNNWTPGGTTPAVSTGAITFSAATTASTIGYLRSNAPFNLMSQAYLRFSYLLKLETTAAVTNSTRWWGYGTNQGTPTAAAPVLNGAVYLLDYAAGAFQAAYYANGTKTVVATLTKPTDGLNHKYEIWFKQSTTYWVVDGITVATANMANYSVVSGQYLILGSAVHTTAATSAPTYVVNSISASDSGRNNQQISDGALPWIKSTVKQSPSSATNQVLATDNALLVLALPPVSTNATTLGTAGVAVTLTLAAPGAGLRHYITGIWFERYATGATTAAASGLNSTATNSTLAFSLPSDALTIGQVNFPVAINFQSPVAATAQNTATTFTAPLVANTVYRISVTYFIAP